MDLTSNGACKALSTVPAPGRHPLSVAVAVVVGIPGIETEDNFEEDSHRPLINGAENEDEAEPNYSIQEGNTVTQVKAINFYQACGLPGIIAYSLAYRCLKVKVAQLCPTLWDPMD